MIEDGLLGETAYEIEFIKSLGTNNEESGKIPRADLLQGYVDGCAKRVRWGSINRSKVLRFAYSELSRERAKA